MSARYDNSIDPAKANDAENAFPQAVFLLPLALLAAAGCNQGKQLHQDLYTRELRLQEDEIYRLEDYLEEYQQIVRDLRCENRQLKQQVGSGHSTTISNPMGSGLQPLTGGGSNSGLLDSSSQRPALLAPASGDRSSRANDANANDDSASDNDVPAIDLGEPTEPPASAPPKKIAPSPTPVPPVPTSSAPPASTQSSPPEIDVPEFGAEESGKENLDEAPPFNPGTAKPLEPAPRYQPNPTAPPEAKPFEPLPPPKASEPIDGEAPLFNPAANGAAINQDQGFSLADHEELLDEPNSDAHSLIAPQTVATVTLRGEMGSPEPTGEATLIAIVSPRTVTGSAAPFSGQASLMLRDPKAPAESAKLARWDFNNREVAESWGDLQTGAVLELALVLPENVPMDRPLELWVRLVDDEGRKTLSQAEVVLEQPLAKPQSATTIARQLSPVSSDKPTKTQAQVELNSTGWAARPGSTAARPVMQPPMPLAGDWKRTPVADPPAGPTAEGSTIRLTTHEEPVE